MRTVIIFVMILWTTGCSPDRRSYSENPSDIVEIAETSLEEITLPVVENQAKAKIPSHQQPSSPPTTIEKKIIKSAYLNLQVLDLDSTKKTIEASLTRYGAYLAQSDQSNRRGSTHINMMVRVPSENLDNFLVFIEHQGHYLHQKEISSLDVTEEYVDVSSRLENKRQAQRRFREILEQAKSIEEILKVEEHLRKVSEEIESVEGRLRFLGHQTAYSSVKISFYQPNYLPAKAPGQSYLSQLAQAFSSGWEFLQKILLGLIRVWPLVLILLGAILLILRRVQNQSRKTAM